MRHLSDRDTDRALIYPRAFYALYFGAMATLAPFIVLYYQQIGLSGQQIGVLSGIAPVVTLFSAPLWGGISDATRQHKRLALIALAGALICMLAISRVDRFALLIPLVALYAFFIAPVLPLIDRTVLDLLGARKEDYGRQRLWGSVGWGLTGPLAGLFIQRMGLLWSFYLFALFIAVALLVTARMPIRSTSLGQPFWQGMRQLVTNRPLALFFIAMFLQGVGRSSSFGFFYLHMNDLGAGRFLVGLMLTVAAMSELPSFFFSGTLLRRFGSRALFIVSLTAATLMLLSYSIIRNPWLVLLVQVLTGPSFSLMWVAGVSYTDRMAPQGMGATAQGLFSAVSMGLASGVGALIGGWMYDHLGAVWLFRWAGFMVVLGLGFLMVTYRESPAEQPAVEMRRDT
ncbi:MAG TPA: MFS transporter [Chloroflexi bacterium]|jgi:PPP family 3-phenylpropionic acid transporter|nr:MFS transporter [Chloroflexota bacterium]